MWQASLDTQPDLVRLLLTQRKPSSSDPWFVTGREWSSPVGKETVEVQLHFWEQEFDIKIERVVCTSEELCPAGWPTVMVCTEQVDFLTGFWQTLTLPPWQRGLAIAILSLQQQHSASSRMDLERSVLAGLARRITAMEAFLYADDLVDLGSSTNEC